MKTKQKIIAVVLTVMLVAAFPMMAFAATSPTNDIANHPTNNGIVVVDYAQSGGKQALTVTDTTPSAAMANQANATGPDATHYSIVGAPIAAGDMLAISFPVAKNGVTYIVYHELSNGTIVSYSAVSANGYVTINSILELGNFSVVSLDPYSSQAGGTGTTAGSGASTSATSPATGA